MKIFAFFLFVTVSLCFSSIKSYGQKIGKYPTVLLEASADLQKLVDSAASQTLAKFADKGFKAENLSITLIEKIPF